MPIASTQNAARGPLASLESGTTSSPDVAFPKDELLLIDHWVTFRAFETKQLDRHSQSQQQSKAKISLPMPGNLQNAYNISYNDTGLNAIEQTIVDAVGAGPTQSEASRAVSAWAAAGAVGGAVSLATGGNLIEGITAGAVGGGIIDGINPNSSSGNAGASALINNRLGETVGGALLAQAGLAINPHKVILFQAVNFRTHTFAYQFTPKSYEEAEILRQIVHLFKFHASPSFDAQGTLQTSNLGAGSVHLPNLSVNASAGRHFFKYPEYFEIEFHNKDFLFEIGPSVLESVQVDYHPAGMPTYSRTNGRKPTPTQINLTLSFKETEIVTKENIGSQPGAGR